MRGWLRSTVAIVCLAAAGLTHAQSVSYTVQVVALSDSGAALGIQTDLIRDGFPAYVVRSASAQGDAQGDVFRVRVGAFANRAAALLYASGMPKVAGAEPVPALAESIPLGIMPLAPQVLLDEPVAGRIVTVGTLGEQLVLRLQALPLADQAGSAPPVFAPAEYVIIDGATVERQRAWRFGAVDGAQLWVRDTLLWPPTWRDETEEVREGFRASLLRLLAERLDVDVADVEAATYRPEPQGAPRLIVVELEAPEQPDGVLLLGLGLPAAGFDAVGPLEYLGTSREELPPLISTVSVDELLAEPAEVVEAEAFTASSDGAYIRLQAGGSSWRAGLGTPLWTDGRRLMAVIADRLLVYGFVQR